MNIYTVGNSIEFDKYGLEEIPEHDVFVYYYETAPYEGSGFAAWKNGDKFGYHDLGHCSCYGPLDHIDSRAIYTLDELVMIADGYSYNKGPEVVALLKEKI
jgi:hypothetical protein